ncbi:unnamed protein product [Callosobruchus maculatus]|nr:unnamed protein product [Callosobruchus maculatus]
MGETTNKLFLLNWKNWTLQARRPFQTILDILFPVLISLLLLYLRSKVDPELRETQYYEAFCTTPIIIGSLPFLCPQSSQKISDDPISMILSLTGGNGTPFRELSLLYSPKNPEIAKMMGVFKLGFNDVIAVNNSEEMASAFKLNAKKTFAGIQFDESYSNITDLKQIKNFRATIRFPGELRFPNGMDNDWQTEFIYPPLQKPGPRDPDSSTGAYPSYHKEGFLLMQHVLAISFMMFRDGIVTDGLKLSDVTVILGWMKSTEMPLILMQRFPYSEWYDDLLMDVLKLVMGVFMILSFLYPCINTVKMITIEKEKQLKESMKIMGLPNWLHWTSWFIKYFIYMFIAISLMLVILKIPWFSKYSVFTYSDTSVLLIFLIFYITSTITFSFIFCTLFSKANRATMVAGVAWTLTIIPYAVYLQMDNTGLATKIFMSFCSNSAMSFAFEIIFTYEGIGEGVQWSNIFQPMSPDDGNRLGFMIMMLILDTVIYMLIALYIEAVFPGEYGVPMPWNFPFTMSYWRGNPSIGTEVKDHLAPNDNEYFEKEPKDLVAGVQIRNLRKVFGSKAAVQHLSMNMYENQITVLLGHNGAGKTTTLSMLTGMITPTSGTAIINGYDIRRDMYSVRKSMGICPQHDVIFEDLTVAEHLYFYSRLKGLSKKQAAEEIDKYIEMMELTDERNAKASTLSGGMKRKLSVCVALCGNSKVIMLDEPTSGMDPSARRALWDLLLTQKKGRTILLTTHFMDEADVLGDRIAIMADGELKCCGSSFFLKKKYGAGYIMTIAKGPNCDVGKVTTLLKTFIPEIEISTNTDSELTYLLPENRVSVFEGMLTQLEGQSSSMGVKSYGISLTTLEDVFMKVGADPTQELNKPQDLSLEDDNLPKPSYTSSMNLIKNQCAAMFLKKYKAIQRSWLLWLVHFFLPPLFVILIMAPSRLIGINDLPAMPLTLSKYEDPIVLVEKGDDLGGYYDSYKELIKWKNYDVEDGRIVDDMIQLTKDSPGTVRKHYIVGASFNHTEVEMQGSSKAFPTLTVWFNNDPYHSPGVALSLALSAVFRKISSCNDCDMQFTNDPFPFSDETQVNKIVKGENKGQQLAVYLTCAFVFTSCFYIMFLIKENTSKSRHLQFVAGVKIYVFWIVNFLCDFATYLVIIVLTLITLVSFQEDGYKTAEDLGRFFVILLYFGWAFFPMIYIATYFFDVPANGFARMSAICYCAGVISFQIIKIMKMEAFKLKYVTDPLHYIMLLIPHYSLASGISESYTTFSYQKLCDVLFEKCALVGLNKHDCLRNMTEKIVDICGNPVGVYYKWDSPGIARNILFSTIGGFALFLILFLIEYDTITRLVERLIFKLKPQYPIENIDEDSDVAEERKRIRDMTVGELTTTYDLAVKDLTKYYKKFLAVNGLCLGVKRYECFGLLGANGAGKTSTFKMMTGDVRMTYGEGWVKGHRLRSEMRQVHRVIGYCPQFDALLDDMTARETIIMYALIKGFQSIDASYLAENLSQSLDFRAHIDKQVKQMSGGNKRKLSTAIALIGDPSILFFDEPTSGMDPATKHFFRGMVCKIRDKGKCIVLTSHGLEECEALCTRLAIMVNGNFKCLGSVQHLKNKFAKGCSFSIKIKKDASEDSTRKIEKYIEENLPTAQLRESHEDLLTYSISNSDVPWSKMFGVLEAGRRNINEIEDYSLGQGSLEQVFLSFTKKQN